jgi:general secretion pathway protein G
MNPYGLLLTMVVGSGMAVSVGLPEQMMSVFDEAMLAARQTATAGDLRSVSMMLDADYVRGYGLPAEARFESWLAKNFKESSIKNLAVDHWDHPYVYRRADDGRSYVLRSVGPDGVAETADDMSIKGP